MMDHGATLAPRERDRDTPFALGEFPRTWGDLLDDVAAVARRLPRAAAPESGNPGDAAGGAGAPGELMVACSDRYLCAVALLAVWQSGGVAALPPNGRPETIDALCAARGMAAVLHDGGGRGGLDVRGLLDGPRTAPPAPLRFAVMRTIVSVYTSGSTGEHLACRKTAGQILGEARLLVRLFNLGPKTRLLATVPPHHIYGLLFGLLVPFMGGGAFVRGAAHHAETIADLARRERANVLCSVPAHLHGLAALAAGQLPGLARIFSSGAPLDQRTAADVAALTGTAVTEVLGSSETGGIAWRTGGGGPAWQPLPGVRVEADAGGMMLVESPFLSSLAPSSPQADAPGDARHRGADRILPLGDGRFELLGRADGVVKIGGGRISIAEIERLLREIPGVSDAAVLQIDVDGPRQHELWAAVAAPGLSPAELRAALSRRLEPIALPRRFRIVAALPREENGKLVKARLQALFAAPGGGPAAAGSDAATGSDVVAALDGALAAARPESVPPEPLSPESVPRDRPAPERQTVEVTVPADSPYFRGHFDELPILPGVVQLGELVLRRVRARWPELRHLRRIAGLKFKSPIFPDDVVVIDLARTAPGKVTFELRRGAGAVSSGTLLFELPAAEPGGAPAAATAATATGRTG
jgi:acyl-coenzyme A synthetase/AMP-(fatty) acid ligase